MTTISPVSDRTRLRIHPERAQPEQLGAILARGLIAHVGIAEESGPVVIPMTYYVDADAPERIYIHGGHHSRLMNYLESGKPVCVTVTMVDGLVYSRSAKYHSANYRSAVCFGRGRVVTDPKEQRRVSDGMISRYFPGRQPGVDYDVIPEVHLQATSFVSIEIEEGSAKVRQGGPRGPRDGDPEAAGTAGQLIFDPPR